MFTQPRRPVREDSCLAGAPRAAAVALAGIAAAWSPPSAAATTATAAATTATAPPVADLLEVREAAFAHDASLKRSRAEWQAAAAARGEAIAALLPSITASRERLENRYDSSPTTLSDTETDYWRVHLRQELFSLPAFHGIGQVNANIARARSLWLQAQQDFMMRVADAYFGQLRAASNLVFARAEERALEQQLDQARQRFSVGLAPIVDVQDARASHSLSIANRLAQQAERARTSEALRAIAGRYYTRLASLSADYRPSVPPEARAWVRAAPERSPAVQAAFYAMRAARKDAKVQGAKRWPALGLDWTYTDTVSPEAEPDDIGSLFSGAQDGHRILLSASMPLFSGGAITSQARQARRRMEAETQRYEQARRDVVEQARSLLNELRIGVSRVEANRQAVIAARSAVDAVQAGYRAGTRNLVDVLNAQAMLFRAGRDHANVRHDFVLSLLRLRMRTGILSPDDLREVNGWLAR